MNALGTDGKIPKKGILEIDYESPMTLEHYKGEFAVRRKSLEDEGKVSQMLHILTNGTEIVDTPTRVRLTAIANLSIVVEEYPDWWEEVQEFADTATIIHVFSKYTEWQLRPFRERRKLKEEEEKSTKSG